MKDEIEISQYGNLLVYKKGYTLDFVRATIQKKKLNGLRIFSELSDQILTDLNFLSHYSFLTSLNITSRDDYDFSFLSELKGLKELSISTMGKNPIDLSNLVNLEKFAIEWRKGKIFGLELCQNLTWLCLIDFKEVDFSAISQLTKLKDLQVKTASVKTLNGIQTLSSLENVLLGNCRLLKSIDDISGLQNLSSLEISTGTQIEDYAVIGSLSNLKRLKFEDCKGIASIKFIEHLQNLERLSLLGNTTVLDGDMIPALNVSEVFHKHKKHYNVRVENKKNDELIKSNLDKIKSMFGLK